jgi:aminopeptidase YwaD
MGRINNQFYKTIGMVSFCLFTFLEGNTQTFDKNVAAYINNVENPFSFLQKCENLGIKLTGTRALDSTYSWLNRLIKQEGYQTNTQYFLYGNDTLKNIEFVKQGDNDSCIILCAHYDTWVGAGVNDNGTGDFALYQFAKWLKPLKSKYTLRFIYFSGEEIGFVGSKHYVSKLDKDSVKIKFVINFDQLGGTVGENNSAVKCERDEVSGNKVRSNEIASNLANFYNLYTNLTGVVTPAYSSDYIPFRDSGYIISGIYQYANYPYYHSTSDLLNYVDLPSLTSTVKGALAAIIFFSNSIVPEVNAVKNNVKRNVTVYNTHNALFVINAANSVLNLSDALGRQKITRNISNPDFNLSLSDLPNGVYYVSIVIDNTIICKKIFIYP